MNQFVDLSMERAVHHRFHTFTRLRVIFDDAKNSNKNDNASSTGDACHMRITNEGEGPYTARILWFPSPEGRWVRGEVALNGDGNLSATAIEYRDHSGLDRVVRQLETIAHGELLKNIIEMSFDGALGDRKPLGNFGVP